jgi:hypothetical protein
MTDEEIKSVKHNLKSFLILLIAICQIYAYRLAVVIDSLVNNDMYGILIDNPIFYVSKTIMVIGFCYSIFLRLKTAQQHGNRVTQPFLADQSRDESALSVLEISIASDDKTWAHIPMYGSMLSKEHNKRKSAI